MSISEGGDSDSGVVLCDSEFSDATIELSDTAIDDLGEVNSRVRSDSTSKMGSFLKERTLSRVWSNVFN